MKYEVGVHTKQKLENNHNGKRPQWKTTSTRDDLNGRRPQWKKTSM